MGWAGGKREKKEEVREGYFLHCSKCERGSEASERQRERIKTEKAHGQQAALQT